MGECLHKHSSHHNPMQIQRKTTHAKLLERNLKDLLLEELVAVADEIKTPTIAILRLYVTAHDSPEVNDRFTLLDKKSTQACLHFAKALAQAIAGWLQQLELGMRLWNRELKLLAEALCCTKTLRRVSFANSGLGDTRFQILARSLRECVPLQTLNLSRCELTDLSVPYIVNIINGSPNIERPKPEEYSLGQSNLRQALVCQLKLQKAQKSSHEWSSKQFPLQGKWAPEATIENGTINKKDVKWQTTLRQFGASHNIRIPSNVTANKALGLRALDLSYNQFTDDLADELCSILYGDAPLSSLNLQSNQLTQEGAKTFEAVMKKKRVLQIVDLRDNKQKIPTPVHSTNVASIGAKSIPCLIYPKEAYCSYQQTTNPNAGRSSFDKYRRNLLAKPRYVSKIHTVQSTTGKNKPTRELTHNRLVCINPLQVAINKLPLRPKSAPEHVYRPIYATPRFYGQQNPVTNCFTSQSSGSEFEFNSLSLLNAQRNLRCKPSCNSKRQMKEPTTSRPKSTPNRIRIPLCSLHKTPRGKAYFKSSKCGSSLNSACNQSHRSLLDEIAPWEDQNTTNVFQHPKSTLPSKIDVESNKNISLIQEDKTCLQLGRRLKKTKNKSQISNSKHAIFRTITTLEPLLGNKNIPTCLEKQKKKPKMKPNVVKRMELNFQSRKDLTIAKVQEIPSTSEAEEVPTTTPLVSNEYKELSVVPTAVGKKDTHEWNSFMSEMTKTLLNVNGTRLPHLSEIVQTQV